MSFAVDRTSPGRKGRMVGGGGGDATIMKKRVWVLRVEKKMLSLTIHSSPLPLPMLHASAASRPAYQEADASSSPGAAPSWDS